MTKNEAVQVNQIYSIFKRPLFSGHLCPDFCKSSFMIIILFAKKQECCFATTTYMLHLCYRLPTTWRVFPARFSSSLIVSVITFPIGLLSR